MGESGSGKTTSLRNLPPEQTFYIDADKKGLSWKGWRDAFNSEHHNYVRTSEQNMVLSIMKKIDKGEEFKGVHYLVIDTLNGIMIDDEMSRMREKNYDKWVDLAVAVYEIVNYSLTMRDDLAVIMTAHTQTERDDSGNTWTHVKTSGKKLDKIVLESKFTTVLQSKQLDDGSYVFETRAANSTAKTPMGAFSQQHIPNDIVKVLEVLKDY